MLLLTVNLQANWQQAADTLEATNGSIGDHFGYSVDIGEQFAVVGAPDTQDGGAAYIFKKEDNGTWSETQRLNYSISQRRTGLAMTYISGFGASVAVAENVDFGNENPHLIVVGAPDSYIHTYDDDIEHITGAVCTFEYNASTEIWAMQDSCTYGDLLFDDDHNFGHSVGISNWVMIINLDGIISYISQANLIVGDPNIDDTYDNEGKVTFLDYNTSGHNWNETVVVDNPSNSGDNNINFGYSVALENGNVAIGAPGTHNVNIAHGGAGNNQMGTVYFYNASGTYLSEFAPEYDGDVSGHRFGSSVDMSDGYAIVSELHRLGGESLGAAYILKKIGTQWLEDTLLEGSVDGYGTSVAINSSHAIVGAPIRNYLDKFTSNTVYTGAVYLYGNRGSSGWNELAYYYGSANSTPLFFGQSVSLFNNSLMVGAHKDEQVQPYQYSTFIPAIIMYLLD